MREEKVCNTRGTLRLYGSTTVIYQFPAVDNHVDFFPQAADEILREEFVTWPRNVLDGWNERRNQVGATK
jgi:hypothetical protein